MILFSFPFLILAFLAHYKELKAWQNAILVLIIMTLGSVTLTSNRQHFKLFYESPYKEILKEQEIAFRINPKTLRLINNYPKVNKYYGSFMPIDTNYVAAQKFNTEKEFLEFLELNSEDYDQLFYGTKYSANPLFIPAILSYYPVIKETKNYAGGSAYLFSKGTPNFPKLFSSKKLQSADSTEFIPLFSFSPAEKGLSQIDHLDVSVEFRPRTSYKEIFIVSAVMHKDSTLLWRSTNIEKFDLVSKWIKAHHTLDLSFIKRPLNEVSIKVYIWNPEKKPFDFRHVNSHFRKGNPYIHALYNEITE